MSTARHARCRISLPGALTIVMALVIPAACGRADRPSAAKAGARSRSAGEPSRPAPQHLMADDFSARVLDPLRWRVVLPPGRTPEVFVRDGRVVIQNRGHLNTVDQFDPAAPGGLRITGEWTVGGAPDDFLQILTRSDGIPVPPHHETRDGLEFLAMTLAVGEAPSYMTIVGRGAAGGTVTDVYSPGTLLILPGTTYRFRVTDDGRTISFTLTSTADSTQTRTVTARSGYQATTNFVTFHNREHCCVGSHAALLDDVVIAHLTPDSLIPASPSPREVE